MQKKEFIVGEEEKGSRLDKYLSEKLKNLSRSSIQNLISKGKVKVNNLLEKPSYRVKGKDLIEVFLEEVKTQGISLIRLDIPIIYQDEDIVVVDKPADLIVHPLKDDEPSVVGDLLARGVGLSLISPSRPGVVHRLDKATSGVMVLARNNTSYLNLLSQFRDRRIIKEYIAIVEGKLKEDEGKIDLPLKRLKYKPKMKVGFINAKKALTFYQVLQRKDNFSLLLLKPHTGRMHQIRVHLSFLGHPIVGDRKYKGVKASRLFLHSYKLGLFHPRSNEFMWFTSEPPAEFMNFLSSSNTFLAGNYLL